MLYFLHRECTTDCILKYIIHAARYRPAFFYWEVLELLRRIVLTGVVLLLPHEHAMMRLLMSLLLSILFLVAVTVLQPYRRTDNNTIATATQLAMCSSLLLAIFIKAHGDMVSELRNIDNGEDRVERVLGFSDPFLLSVSIFVLVILVSVGLLFILVQQARH